MCENFSNWALKAGIVNHLKKCESPSGLLGQISAENGLALNKVQKVGHSCKGVWTIISLCLSQRCSSG